jgi:DNA-binding beta-propeller fold protein YncE
LPSPRTPFADFLLGTPAKKYPLLKPINTVLSGTKLYVCDTVLSSVIVYDLASGETHVLAGDHGIGKIKQPNNITTDPEGHLLISDKLRGAVLVYGPDESFQAAWGRPGKVQPVAAAAGQDVLYVCDVKDHEVEVWDRHTGEYLRSIGSKGKEPGQFNFPTYVAVDKDGNLFVSDTGNFRVQKLSPQGEPLAQIGQQGDALGHFAWPKGIDVDDTGHLYVVDARFPNIQIFDANTGKLLLFFGGPGAEAGNLELPSGVRVFPWPNLPWLSARLVPGFDPGYLLVAVNQFPQPMVNLFAVARAQADSP